jgi:hypothetical protein
VSHRAIEWRAEPRVAGERGALGQRDRRHAVTVERREELRLARERSVGTLPGDEEVDPATHALRVRPVTMRLPRTEERQQRQSGDAVVAPRPGPLAMLPLDRPLDAGAVLGRGPAAIARLGRHQPGERRLHGPFGRLRAATGGRGHGPTAVRPVGIRVGNGMRRGGLRRRVRHSSAVRQSQRRAGFRRVAHRRGRRLARRWRLGIDGGDLEQRRRFRGPRRFGRGHHGCLISAGFDRDDCRWLDSSRFRLRVGGHGGIAGLVVGRIGGQRDRERHPALVVQPPRRGPDAADDGADQRQHCVQQHGKQHALRERVRLQPAGADEEGEPNGRRHADRAPDDPHGLHVRPCSAAPRVLILPGPDGDRDIPYARRATGLVDLRHSAMGHAPLPADHHR